ncbi:MAG: hypothetical protein ACRDNZ_03015, partial [Streptosporangiaceae bacterium]
MVLFLSLCGVIACLLRPWVPGPFVFTELGPGPTDALSSVIALSGDENPIGQLAQDALLTAVLTGGLWTLLLAGAMAGRIRGPRRARGWLARLVRTLALSILTVAGLGAAVVAAITAHAAAEHADAALVALPIPLLVGAVATVLIA